MQIVTRELLEALCADNPPPPTAKADRFHSERADFDLSAWIASRLPDAKERAWSEGRKWILPTCPFDAQHDRGEACIVQFASGAVSAKCQHDSCVWGWTELRSKLEPEYAERRQRSAESRKTTDRTPPPNGETVYEHEDWQAIQDDIDRNADADRDPPKAQRPIWWRAPELVGEILARKDDPWASLTLGGDELCRVRAGGTAVIIGGSGSGKSSLASSLMVEHARDVGPAIALSIELPAEELGARIVGIRSDATWEAALRGGVSLEQMTHALALPRLYVLDRRRATLRNLEKAIDAARADYPGQTLLVVVDYAQLLDSKEREARQRVADVFAQIDDLAREKRVVVVALSQMSRASAQKARKGEALGAEAADLGAETAAIERFATVTLSIGLAAEREDGSSAVELSIGKMRMGKGDRVIPMTYEGKSGLWRVAGEAKTADKVREERDEQKTVKENRAIEQQIVGALARSDKPLSGNELCELIVGRKTKTTVAIKQLVTSGEIVQIARYAPRSKKWLLWTEARALAAGAPLVRDQMAFGDRE